MKKTSRDEPTITIRVPEAEKSAFKEACDQCDLDMSTTIRLWMRVAVARVKAGQMGHVGVNVLMDHYRALVTPEEAVRFWAIRPENEKAGC